MHHRSVSMEIVRRGALILFCDYVVCIRATLIFSWRPNVAVEVVICLLVVPWVQLFIGTGNHLDGRIICCGIISSCQSAGHSDICKALLVTNLTRVHCSNKSDFIFSDFSYVISSIYMYLLNWILCYFDTTGCIFVCLFICFSILSFFFFSLFLSISSVIFCVSVNPFVSLDYLSVYPSI